MSFTFNWPRFSDQFHYDAIQMLNTALNKGNKPPIIADKIEVVELEMGSQPPELEIRDIGDLTVDQFRGIFRLTYSGDAHLVLKTKVQANPLNHKQPDIHLMAGSRGMLAAKQPLVVPMLLRLSHFKLNSYVVLVVSKQKGITLVFKTDPLQNVDINSTFDSIAVIQKFIQREIEGQLRQMFREDLPGIIHRLSQQWVKAKVEAPYLEKRPPPVTRHTFNDARSFADTHASAPLPNMTASNIGLQPFLSRQQSLRSLRRPRSVSGSSITSAGRHTTASTSALPRHKPTPMPSPLVASESVSFPDLENFDPTYGLRPEGLPTKSVFRGFSSLFTPNKGLADLTEETSDPEDDEDYDESASFDMVNWDYTVPDSDATPPPSVYDDRESVAEYETIPAVGGGTITRPRIYHSQSLIQTTPSPSKTIPSHHPRSSYGGIIPPRSGFATPGLISRHQSTLHSSYFDFAPPIQQRSTSAGASTSHFSALPHGYPQRPSTPESVDTQSSRSSSGRARSMSTPPTDLPLHDDYDENDDSVAAIYMRRPPHSERRFSISSSTSNNPNISSLDNAFLSSQPNSHNTNTHGSGANGNNTAPRKIVLRPSLNDSIHQLSTLSHSNHTLSPYTRSLEHFTVRSVPPRCVGPSGLTAAFERQPVKAKRKRTHRLGGRNGGAAGVSPDAGKTSERVKAPAGGEKGVGPPSEFDMEDMDRYFRSHSPAIPSPPPLPSPSINSVPPGSFAPGEGLRRPSHLQHLHNHHNHPA
ncbi:hypothetical protein BDZ94DRAFT_1235021 [Collybia nuda]|uniref:Mitochondrial distribution and morphology protein 34 n=1 Tax=Collybia nuda TaxID=64659 RepID=A0A9P5Y9V2_9AGAR|nr:hypothetical protein BDZ94DRAFT_1235021 [Collybia nuda]